VSMALKCFLLEISQGFPLGVFTSFWEIESVESSLEEEGRRIPGFLFF